jgi:hypothetical protein
MTQKVKFRIHVALMHQDDGSTSLWAGVCATVVYGLHRITSINCVMSLNQDWTGSRTIKNWTKLFRRSQNGPFWKVFFSSPTSKRNKNAAFGTINVYGPSFVNCSNSELLLKVWMRSTFNRTPETGISPTQGLYIRSRRHALSGIRNHDSSIQAAKAHMGICRCSNTASLGKTLCPCLK